MTSVSNQADPFIATRNHHESELAEDYAEIVFDLIAVKGEAKVCDIAKHFGVSHVTVIRTIDRLRKKGVFAVEPEHSLILTEEGKKVAVFSKERHLFLLKYLTVLGVSRHQAEIDVEGMEHHVSQETMDAFQRHLNLLNLSH